MPEILSGDLTSLRLIDILRILHQNAKTGRLQVTLRAAKGEIYFTEGEIVHASYGGQTGEEVMYSLLAWSQGSFIFTPKLGSEEKTVATATKEILARGDTIDKEWESIRDVIPSGDTVFSQALPTPADLRLSDLETALLHEINGHRTVLDVAEQLHTNELEVSRAVRKLFLLGLIEVTRSLDDPDLDTTLDISVFDVIQFELTKVLGPIAPVILDEQIERMGESRHYFPKARLAELAELLSREIPGNTKQVRFQQVMVQLLK